MALRFGEAPSEADANFIAWLEGCLQQPIRCYRKGNNGKGDDWYYTLAYRLDDGSGTRRRAEDFSHRRIIGADFDPSSAEDPGDAWRLNITEGLLSANQVGDFAPHIIIDSGRGIQALWVLSEYVPESAEVYRRVAAYLERSGSDPAVKDISRLWRLPGTINSKTGRAASIIYSREGSVSFDALCPADAILAAQPKQQHTSQSEMDDISWVEDALNWIRVDDYQTWRNVLFACKDAGIDYDTFDNWCRSCGGNYNESNNRELWAKAKAGRGITKRAIWRLAEQSGWQGVTRGPATVTIDITEVGPESESGHHWLR